MKRKYNNIIILLLLTISLPGMSQGLRIDTMYIVHNDQKVMALKSSMEPDVEFVKKQTADFYYKHFKLSFKGKSELVAKEVLIPEISSKRMNFFILLETDNFGTTVYNFAQLGFDIYIDTLDYKNEFTSMNRIFSDYLVSVHNAFYKSEIERLQKEMKKANKEKKQLTKNNKKLDKKIAKATKAIKNSTSKEGATDKEAKLIESKLLELESNSREYNTEKQYNNQRLVITKGNLNRLASNLEKINQKLHQLTTTKTIP